VYDIDCVSSGFLVERSGLVERGLFPFLRELMLFDWSQKFVDNPQFQT
jgi:hypothetical protein